MSHEKLFPIKLFLKARRNVVFFGIALLINLATWVWVLLQIRPQPEPVFLHYNILFGVDYIGAWWQVYTLPATGLVILIINAVLGWLLYHRDAFVSLMLGAIAALSQIFLLIATALLVFLNV